MATAIIGCDPSSKKLASVITRDDVLWDTQAFWVRNPNRKAEIPLACRNAYVYVRTLINELHDLGDDIYIAVEEPLLGRGGPQATIPQAKVFGAVMAAASIYPEVHIISTPVPTWKKYYTGKGNSGKQEVAHAVMLYWPALYEQIKTDQDLLDAAAINRYAASVASHEQSYANRLNRPDYDEADVEEMKVGNTILKIVEGRIIGYERKGRKK